ncbi:MnhB domain-containing protein [Kocuria sp. ZOR0020]|uniref:MnhB domain-containing protein n=1 Tax=Kocuria sp. ZOR0020 TaxID=1339234 RepID=UPI000691E668|nr:MnhB domain-containing protein [Kocuria sp. ZOR0020]
MAFLRDDDAQAAPSAQHRHRHRHHHQQGSIKSSTQDLDSDQHHRPSTLVTLYVKVVAPVALLLAAWLLFAGSSQPGGAFQSGAALAAVMILLHTSRLRTFTAGPWMVTVLVVGVIAFLAVALGGLVLGDSWPLLRGPWAGTVTVVLETVLAASIGASLAVIFMATTVDRSRPSADLRQEVSDA